MKGKPILIPTKGPCMREGQKLVVKLNAGNFVRDCGDDWLEGYQDYTIEIEYLALDPGGPFDEVTHITKRIPLREDFYQQVTDSNFAEVEFDIYEYSDENRLHQQEAILIQPEKSEYSESEVEELIKQAFRFATGINDHIPIELKDSISRGWWKQNKKSTP